MATDSTDWREVYPHPLAIEKAGLTTLAAWVQNLPPPADSYQERLRRRIYERGILLSGRELMDRGNTDIVDKYNRLADLCAKIGLNVPKM